MTTPSSDLEKLQGPDRRLPPLPRGLAAWTSVIAVLVGVGMLALWPRDQPAIDLLPFGFADDVVLAEVVEADTGPCSYAPDLVCNRAGMLVVEERSGVLGEYVEHEFPDEPGQPVLVVGDAVLLSVVTFEDGTVSLQYADRERRPLLVALAAVFAAAVVALGRLRGLAALSGLVLSVVILLAFILPAIITGRDAVLVALVGGGAIALTTLYLAHGFNRLTHVAVLGAFSALLLTTSLSWLVVALARFSGLVAEEAFFLLAIPDLDLSGLLLAGIVLGTLGALDDVTVTQASSVWEVHGANPGLEPGDLYAAGLRVGRNHIAATVNTLLLAYAGASLPLLILFNLSAQPLGIVANSEVVALEIVRTLVGSMGLVAAVPITTLLASRAVKRPPVS